MSIAKKAASGAAWNVATSLVTRVVGTVATLVMYRYLAPKEIGEAVGAIIVAQTCLIVSHMGLSQYLVVKRDSGPVEAFHITFYTTLVCALTLGAVFLMSDRIGPFFNVHELGRYLPWLILPTMAERLASVPERILSRELRFRGVALIRASGELVFSVAAVGLAMLGKGGLGYIIAGLLRTMLRSALFIAAVDWRAWLKPHVLRWSVTKELFRFGLPLSPSTVAGAMSTRWDNMVTSRYFDAGVMGVYNAAYQLAEIPVSQVAEQIGDVLLPSFALMSPADRRRAMGRSMALLGIIVFPLGVGLGAISGTLARVIFKPSWTGVADMLLVLSALAVARPISYVVSSYLQAGAHVFAVSATEVLKLVLLFALMVILAPYGILALCMAVGVAFLFHSLIGLWVVSRDGVSFWWTLLGIVRPLLATVPMAAAVFAMRWATAAAGVRSAVLGLILEILAGGVVYVGSAFVIAGPTARELVSLARGVIARRRQPPASA